MISISTDARAAAVALIPAPLPAVHLAVGVAQHAKALGQPANTAACAVRKSVVVVWSIIYGTNVFARRV